MTPDKLRRQNEAASQEYVIRPIGYVRCAHVDPSRTPIQPVYGQGCQARVVVLPEYEEGLEDLDGFSHIMTLYVFHRAGPSALRVKPYLEDVERGVFATRSPRRPNGLGLSLVRLVKRERNVLFIEDEDMLDGSPVVDIKPFIARFDTRSDTRSGWQDGISEDDAKEIGSRRKEPGK
ncbi:MAG: tRNA (N6-threonylcarbamoyladenosine(37)-N6)-methyltransferase TrmO [Candidatus Coatesbacteria bacterium]|nr:tRNA (N6-threonylcarbamoyladenosine(37)-N6)-methyltransferase TrmO [Candidatus Coatesbacteria bacterium]